MALLTVANLTLSLGTRVLLDGVNLGLEAGEHVGLIGRNGCGKSTLLKAIAQVGDIKPDAGQVQVARQATVGYLTQDPELDANRTLREEAASAFGKLHHLHEQLDQVSHAMADAQGDDLEKLMKRYERIEHEIEAAGGYAVDHQIEATLHGVGLSDEFFAVPVGELSGGQKGRLALAKLLLQGADLLLLDEPTNHLDIAGRQWLEQYLQTFRGAVILISHDRWLLDRSVSRIYELESGSLIEYPLQAGPGQYERFLAQRHQRRLAQQRVFEKQQDHIRREKQFIDRYKAGQRAKQARGRERLLQRFQRDEMVDRPLEHDDAAMAFNPVTRSGDLVIAAESLGMAYDSNVLFDHLNLVIKRGDRIGIIGPNGAGKSTLVRCLLKAQNPTAGNVRIGAQLEVGYYRQTHEHLELEQTVVQYLQRAVPSFTEQQARDLAGAFLFSGIEQDKLLSALSGGERSRLVLAALMAQRHNLLVLDEPTNHLDIPSAERLEEALRLFGKPKSRTEPAGTLILITHDRMLLEHLVDQLLIFEPGGHVRHFLGTFSEYLEAAEQARKQAAGPTASNASADRSATDRSASSSKDRSSAGSKDKPAAKKSAGKKSANKDRSKASAKRGDTSSGRTNDAGRTGSGKGSAGKKGGSAHKADSGKRTSKLSLLTMEKLEARIEQCETQIARIDAELSDPQVYRDGEKVRQLQSQRESALAQLQPLEEEWTLRAEQDPS